MEYSNKRKQVNTARSIGNGNASVNTNTQDPAYQAYLQAVLAGRAKADSETMGHRQDLAPSLAAKMSKAFGMDLSQMRLYRSGAMEGTETKGMASGNKIVLSKDIDLNTMAGQAVLGHEISHVRAQSQGIGMGHSGLYQNAGLEHQADVEGMMAARGQSILGESTGMDTGLGMSGIGGLTPLAPGMSASAGAPMQAKDKPKKKPKTKKTEAKPKKKAAAGKKGNGSDFNGFIDSKLGIGKSGTFQQYVDKKYKDNETPFYNNFEFDDDTTGIRVPEGGRDINQMLADKYGTESEYGTGKKTLKDSKMTWSRMKNELNDLCQDMTDEQICKMYENIENTDQTEVVQEDGSKTTVAYKKNLEGRNTLKEQLYKHFKSTQKKYSGLISQMNFQDLLLNRGNQWFREIESGTQFYDEIADKNFDASGFKDTEKEKEFQALAKWAYKASFAKAQFEDYAGVMDPNMDDEEKDFTKSEMEKIDFSSIAEFLEVNNGFEHEKKNMMNAQQLGKYNDYVKKKKLRKNPVKAS